MQLEARRSRRAVVPRTIASISSAGPRTFAFVVPIGIAISIAVSQFCSRLAIALAVSLAARNTATFFYSRQAATTNGTLSDSTTEWGYSWDALQTSRTWFSRRSIAVPSCLVASGHLTSKHRPPRCHLALRVSSRSHFSHRCPCHLAHVALTRHLACISLPQLLSARLVPRYLTGHGASELACS